MADKNRAQGKSKKAMTKKTRLKKKKVKSQPIERRFGDVMGSLLAEIKELEEVEKKVMRACKSWRRGI